MEFLKTDYDKVSYLVNLLTARATGLAAENNEFELLRQELLSNSNLSQYLPSWLRQHRNLDSFWGFIQPKFKTYAERRTYLSEQFTPLWDMLEFGQHQSNIPTQKAPYQANPVARNKRKVFIVHGRDNEAKQEVSRFIENNWLGGNYIARTG